MIEEVRRQFRTIPGILEGTGKPDYTSCVAISTQAALHEMLVPGILSVVTALVSLSAGIGATAVLGLLGAAVLWRWVPGSRERSSASAGRDPRPAD